MYEESQVGGLPANVSSAALANARRGAREADVALELRREFVARELFTQAMEDDFGVVSEVPMGIVSSAVFKARADDAAAEANVAAVQASLAIPVVVEDLPPTPEEHEAAQQADRKARLDAATAQALAEIAARKVAQPAKSAPVAARPAPAPKAPRVPNADECYCRNQNCRTRHIIRLEDAFVPQDSILIEAYDKGVPTHEQLLELAVCRGVFQDNTGLRWYRFLGTRERIARLVASSVEREATRVETVVGGKLGRMVGQAVRREAQKPVASTASSSPAKPREETKLEGLAALSLWKKK